MRCLDVEKEEIRTITSICNQFHLLRFYSAPVIDLKKPILGRLQFPLNAYVLGSSVLSDISQASISTASTISTKHILFQPEITPES